MCVTGQRWALAPALAQCETLSHDLTSVWESYVGDLEAGGQEEGRVFRI